MRKLFLSLAIIFSSCSREPQHIQEADRVMGLLVKEARQNHGLRAWGTGGQLMDDVKVFNLDYRLISYMDLTDARKKIVELMEKSILIVNSDTQIRPFLHSYPFNEKNFKLGISFFNPEGGWVPNPYIAYVLVIRGKVSYAIYDFDKKALQEVYSESYEEALKIVRNSY